MQANDGAARAEKEFYREHKSQGIHFDRKTNPSTSSGRYFFPRCYYEGSDGRPGLSGMGIPMGESALEMDATKALSFRAGTNFRREDSDDGWFRVGSVRIHPNDTSVLWYSQTVLEEDPNVFVPDPSEFENGVVTKWGIKDITNDHDLLASAIMMQETIRTSVYAEAEGDASNPTLQFIKVLEQRKLNFVTSVPVQAALRSSTYYVLIIQLCENENDVWRRVRVPAAIDLNMLHDQVIGPVMGWSRCHKAHVYEDPTDGAVMGSYPSKGQFPGHLDGLVARLDYYHIMDDRKLPLALLLRSVGDFISYTYDLQEEWVHTIRLEEVLHDCGEDDSVNLLDGFGACPPEDGKGVEGRGCLGYAEFLRAYKKNPRKPKVKEAVREMKTAHNYAPSAGSPNTNFNPLHFDIDLHRRMLKQAVAGPSLRLNGALGSTKLKASTSGCAVCGNRLKAVLNCSRCGKGAYCSRECQVKDWKEGGHKKVCGKG